MAVVAGATSTLVDDKRYAFQALWHTSFADGLHRVGRAIAEIKLS